MLGASLFIFLIDWSSIIKTNQRFVTSYGIGKSRLYTILVAED